MRGTLAPVDSGGDDDDGVYDRQEFKRPGSKSAGDDRR
jgi:hypothetical protein